MKLQRACLPNNKLTWLVLGNDHLPIPQIQIFIRYLENIERSPNTLRAYANHLKLYWEYLDYINKPWDKVKLTDFAEFISWLRVKDPKIIYLNGEISKRTESTINTIITALSSFYDFHQRLGNTDITLTTTSMHHSRRYKPLLYHISKSQPTKIRLIKLKPRKTLPKIISPSQAESLMRTCKTIRDQFLLALLYETGMRIGQVLGLRHEDISSWDNEIQIKPRIDNINGARPKTTTAYIVHVTPKLMQLYSLYVIKEIEDINSEYVFVQLRRQQKHEPLKYSAVADLFSRLSKKTGIYITPHIFRHTHATELLRNGWDCAKIQKRLGHTSIQTTVNTYMHLSNDDLKKAFIDYQETKRGKEYEFNC